MANNTLPSATSTTSSSGSSKRQTQRWSRDEHAKFLHGLEMFPHGPWSRIAALIGTRTTRQTMAHAQKYRERMARRAEEVHAIWESVGQTATPTSFALLQETVRNLPATATALSSSDEDNRAEGSISTELDELDMRILISLLSPETDGHTSTLTGHIYLEPLTSIESQEVDQAIWSLLADMPGDLTPFGDEVGDNQFYM